MREISVAQYRGWQQEARPHVLLDVRFLEEKQLADLGGPLIPMPELERRWREIPQHAGPVVVYCHHGVRSLHAARFLTHQGFEALSLAGGIDAWSRQIDPAIPLY